MIPYGKQHITDEDIDAVIKVLKSEYLTSGPAVTEFENTVKNFIGVKILLPSKFLFENKILL